MNKSIKVPQYIQNKMHRIAKLNAEVLNLSNEISEWFEKQGIDVHTGSGGLRCGDGAGLDELDYGDDITDIIVARIEQGNY